MEPGPEVAEGRIDPETQATRTKELVRRGATFELVEPVERFGGLAVAKEEAREPDQDRRMTRFDLVGLAEQDDGLAPPSARDAVADLHENPHRDLGTPLGMLEASAGPSDVGIPGKRDRSSEIGRLELLRSLGSAIEAAR